MHELPPPGPPVAGQIDGSHSRVVDNTREIEFLRPARNRLDPEIPYHFLHEQEPWPGHPDSVNTIFLTGKECSFKCLMCDLWKNTLPGPTPPGAIVRQLDHALSRLPPAATIKVYNNGNFFDPKAVPPEDHPAMLRRLNSYRRIIVENHPRLIGDSCLRFRDGMTGILEIAMGLETIHPGVLPRLNKRLDPKDFQRAAAFLTGHGVRVRAFILLNPPYLMGRNENIQWTVDTVKFAFECGAQSCSIIATRGGNGIMDALLAMGQYLPPDLSGLEEAFERSLDLAGERLVFADTWNIGFLSVCPLCFDSRKARIERMNREQIVLPPITCSCNRSYE